MPNAEVLYFLFSATATIIATLTGLIGAFSTFRLQNINEEISLLKDLILQRKINGLTSLNEYITGESYHLLEKVYDRNIASIDLLDEIFRKQKVGEKSNEFEYDLRNLRTNQEGYDSIKRMAIRSFALSLVFVLGSLILLVFTNSFLNLQGFYWYTAIYFLLIAILLLLYVIQIAKLIK